MVLLVHQFCIFFKQIIASGPCGLLKKMNGLWIVSVLLTLASHLVGSHTVQCQICGKSQRVKGLGVQFFYVFFDIFDGNTTYTAYRAGKVFVDNILGNTDCLKNLGALIGLNGRNTHLGSNLYNTA